MPVAEKDESLVMFSIRVPRSLRDQLSAIAARTGVTVQEIGRTALEAELEVRAATAEERESVLARERSLRKARSRPGTHTPSP